MSNNDKQKELDRIKELDRLESTPINVLMCIAIIMFAITMTIISWIVNG